MSNTQVVQSPLLYTNNLQVAWGSNTTLTMAAGQKRNSTNVADMILSSGVTCNAAVNGANGLDTGTFAASTWYYLHFIFNSTAPATTGASLLSLSATAPTLPSGYDTFALQAVWLTDGSTHFIKGYVAGNGSTRQHYWDANIATAITAGTATTLTAVDLSVGVPPIENTPVYLQVDYTPATANDTVSIATAGSTATVLPHVTGSVAAKVNTGQLKVISKLASSVAKVQYINSAAAGSTAIWVSGFEYFV